MWPILTGDENEIYGTLVLPLTLSWVYLYFRVYSETNVGRGEATRKEDDFPFVPACRVASPLRQASSPIICSP